MADPPNSDERRPTAAADAGLPAHWPASSRRVAAAAAVAIVLVSVPLGGLRLTTPAWLALAGTVLLFGVSSHGRVARLLDDAGGPITTGLVALLVAGSGGSTSPFMDMFAIALVYSAIVGTWTRLWVNIALVVAATATFGVVEAVGVAYYADLVADVAVWATIAVLAGALSRRLGDVARRHRADAALVAAAETALITTDRQGTVLTWNPAAERLYGIAADEAVGEDVAELVDALPDDPARSCSMQLEQLYYATRHRRRDGTPIDVEITTWPVPAADGDPSMGLLVRDVSTHRLLGTELSLQQRRFRAFAEQARGVVYRYELEPKPHLSYLSPRMQELLGLDAAAVQADPTVVLSRIHPDDGQPFDPTSDDGRFDEGVHEYRVQHTDGSWVWVEDHHQPERADDGTVVASQGILYDVSARKQFEEARERALADARETARQLERTTIAQTTFLRSVSHQLRTPMTLVRGFASTLRRRGDLLDRDERETILDRLLAAIDRLDEHLSDVLDMQADDGEAGLRKHELVDLAQCCFDAVAATDAHGHRVSITTTDDKVVGDREQLVRALRAMLRNAVQHTPDETAVDITMRRDGEDVVVEVADDGPGVDPDIHQRLFDPFVQGRAAATAPSPGAGIGLSFVRQVALRHGGTVEERDVEPHGAVFTLRLPLPPDDVRADRADGLPPRA